MGDPCGYLKIGSLVRQCQAHFADPQLGWSSWWRFNKRFKIFWTSLTWEILVLRTESIIRRLSILSPWYVGYDPTKQLLGWPSKDDRASRDGYWGTPPSPSAGAHVAKQRWTWFLSTFFCIISRNKFPVGDSTWKSTEDIKHRHIITFLSLSLSMYIYILYTYIYVQGVLCMCDNAGHV